MYRLSPENGKLTVRTTRTGAAAKAGHDLLLEVTAWEATVDENAMALDADATSLRVREGTGGMQALGDDDVASIHASIDSDVLKKQNIAFRSTRITPGDDGGRHVEGDLTLVGKAHPVAFDLTEDAAGRVTGRAMLKPSDWGIKQYSILFGALKVADEVVVEIDGQSR